MTRLFRFLALIALVSAVLLGFRSEAQISPVAARIVDPIDDSSRATLHGNISGAAQSRFDRGHTLESTPLSHVRILLSRSAEQQAALNQYQSELQDKSSANYHKWLTPEQFGKLYGPSDADVAAIVGWLESRGLTVETVAPGRTSIAFSGTVSQVEAALHTSIHSFEVGGEQFLSNTTEPSIPASLAPVISGIAHLNTVHPKAQYARGKTGGRSEDPQSANAALELASPDYAGASGAFYLVASDAAIIYDTPNSTLNTNYKTGTTYDGTGVTIGIGGDATIKTSTVVNYRSRFLGNKTAPTITNVDGVTSTNDTDEGYIDTEISGGLAPGAKIHFYTSTDLNSGIEKALTENTVDIFSLSFLECEQDLSTADNQVLNGYWEQAAAQGIAVTVATGDSGSAACDIPIDNGNYVLEAVDGLKVNGYASTPYNVAVGGTDFYTLNTSPNKYLGSKPNKYYGNALGYIPESTWNNSTSNNTTVSQNSPSFSIIAGAGGPSNCSTNKTKGSTTTCTAGYAKPTWQRGTGVPADGVRDIPDISLMAGNGNNDAMWLVCDDSTTTSIDGTKTVPTNCSTQSGSNFYYEGFGGTSVSAPAFAGILALVQQSTGSRLGQAATQLYNLYNGSHSAQIFHDVTVGNNSVPCSQKSPNCEALSSMIYFESGYDTTTGYDLATGMGSVDAAQLVSNWTSASSGAPASLSVTPNLTSITTAESLSLAVTVAGSGGLLTPTGTVTVSGGGYTSSAEPLSNGAYTFTIPAGSLATGTDTFTVTYSGDTNYASETSTTTVTVTAQTLPTPKVTVKPSAAAVTFAQALTVSATVSGTNGTPTGTVTLSAPGYTSPAQILSGGAYTFTIPAGKLAVGSDTLTVSYSGDTNYGTGAGTAGVSVNAAPSTVAVAPASTTILTTQSLSVVATVTSTGGTPTGTVTLSSGPYISPAGTLSSSGNFTFTIPAGQLNVGANTLTVTFSGATDFAPATGTATVTVSSPTVPVATVNVSTSAPTIQSNQPLAVTGSVSGTSGTPTGSVTLTGGGYTSASATLSSTGAYSIAIPSNSLTVGTDSLTVTYSGDTNYASATGTASVVVTTPVTPTFTLVASTPAAIAAGGTATSTVTASATGDYSGTIALSCALTSGPTGASNPPACSLSGSSFVLNTTTTTGSATASVSTTAPSISSLMPGPMNPSGWYKTAGGSVFAALILFLAPGRSRKWRRMLCSLMLMAAFGFAAIGCGGSTHVATQSQKGTPTVSVKPGSVSIASNATVAVAMAVSGSGATPTGTLTLTSGSYTSSAVTLAGGAASVTIPANSLAVGSDTLSVTYSGDTNYNTASGSAALTVTTPVATGGTTPGTYVFTVTGTGNDAAATTATAQFSVIVN